MATAKGWSYSAGRKGRNRVRAFSKPNGALYVEFHEAGCKKRQALGHTDREKAAAQADKLAAALTRLESSSAPATRAATTLHSLIENYLVEVTPSKAPETQRHDRVCLETFVRFFGKNTNPETLSRTDWDRFIRARREGKIGPAGKKPGPVRNRTIAYDLTILRAVLKWGTEARNQEGQFYLNRDPLKGLPYPREASPERPMVTQEQYETLLETAKGMNPTFRLLLILADQTGHRIGALRQLQWSDVDLEQRRVTWPARTDKLGRRHTTPLAQAAVDALREAQKRTGAIGATWIFPAPHSPEEPCSRHAVDQWLERAVKYSGLKVPPRFGWHGFRRKFATDMKDVPLRDLMDAGGWLSSQTILQCYQQPDEDRIRAALEARRKVG
jgi:integrase